MKKFILTTTIITLFACDDDDTVVNTLSKEEQHIIDIEAIDAYIEKNEIEDVQTDTYGIRYVIHDKGNDSKPTNEDTVRVNYDGYYLSGFSFDKGIDISFPLNSVISGWQIGIPYIGEGGSITLYIPSYYGYGTSGYNSIPPNTNLVFDIKLLGILKEDTEDD